MAWSVGNIARCVHLSKSWRVVITTLASTQNPDTDTCSCSFWFNYHFCYQSWTTHTLNCFVINPNLKQRQQQRHLSFYLLHTIFQLLLFDCSNICLTKSLFWFKHFNQLNFHLQQFKDWKSAKINWSSTHLMEYTCGN